MNEDMQMLYLVEAVRESAQSIVAALADVANAIRQNTQAIREIKDP